MMIKKVFFLLLLCLSSFLFAQGENEISAKDIGHKKVYIIPIDGEIGTTNWYIFRRGLKSAIEEKADCVVLDINTPGGEMATMFKFIDALQKFPGQTFAYVNPDAISAGAYISGATQKIFFSPKGKIGAAAVVTGSGGDVDKTMKQKIDSYLVAVTKTFSKGSTYRADVLRAMMDSEYVLKIDGDILKDKNGDPVKAAGHLLTLTADEAMWLVGKNNEPLLGSGIYPSIEELIKTEYKGEAYKIVQVEPLGVEAFAQMIAPFAPILLGLGILLLFIEFKTGGFGALGIIGGVLIAIYFLLMHIAGLAGYEGILIFGVGIILILVEIFLLPGIFIPGILGAILVLVGLFWGSADIWHLPDGTIDFDWSIIFSPLKDIVLALVSMLIFGFVAYKFLPAKIFKNKIVLNTSVGELDEGTTKGAHLRGVQLPDPGVKGVALTDFRPMGVVDIDGQKFDAVSEVGAIQKGDKIFVVGARDYELIVKIES